jgi:mono/diheme cytochrome c family protein
MRVAFLYLVFAAAFLAGDLSARVHVPGVDGSSLEAALKGRVLVEELNCVACHQSPAIQASSRKSPRLSLAGGRINPDYLKAFIQSPHQVKPGTLMPDLLGHLQPGERDKVAEAITHYLVSLNKGQDFAERAPDGVAAELGEKLFHSVGCVACHAPRAPDGKELLRESSVPLGDLEQKYSFKALSELIRRPHSSRPSGRMPDLRLPAREVERITHYLLRKTKVPGHLSYTTWRGKVWEGLKGDVQKEKGGQVDDFALEKIGGVHHQTAIEYTGFLNISNAGDYTFYLEFNGGELTINGGQVALQAPSNRRGIKKIQAKVNLGEGWNQLALTYFHTGRDPRFLIEMEGPRFPRSAIPPAMLSTSNEPIPVVKALKSNPELAAAGREHFVRLGCAQCHDDIKAAPREYTKMANLNIDKGCLAEQEGTPVFDLDDKQKGLIKAALPETGQEALTDRQAVDKTLVAFNCIACHERQGLGGVSPQRNSYFTGTREALGNQGRIPPPLTHVGAKLTGEWLTEVLLRGGRQREYLNTRMPIFGEAQVAHLVDGFAKIDKLEKIEYPKITNIRESKSAGYEMLGTAGLSCIACHDFNGQRSGGAGALELIHVTKRLKKNWFHLYMRQPSRFHPTVIMPSYWPGGQPVRREVLGGDTNRQIEALWDYLSDGSRAKTPKGLSRQSLHLRVADETVMCRGRGTAGYRGIGVGYPERISLAFDSEQMALRQLWKGDFASINHGSFHARGGDRVNFPAGIPFHRLASMDDPWPYKGKTNYQFPQDHGYQYRGYFLSSQKRPTFMYRYGEVAVEDFFEDVLDGKEEAFFKRTLSFSAPVAQQPFFFRLASGKQVSSPGAGQWQADRLRLHVPKGSQAIVRDGDPKDLLLKLTLPKGITVIKLEYRW